jgi:hypothetical protein
MERILQRKKVERLEKLLARKQAALEAAVAGLVAIGSKIYIVPDGAIDQLNPSGKGGSKPDMSTLRDLLVQKQTAIDSALAAMLSSGSTMYMIPDTAVEEFREAIELAASGRDLTADDV